MMFPKMTVAGVVAVLMATATLPVVEAQHAFATCRHDTWNVWNDRYIFANCRMKRKDDDDKLYNWSKLDGNHCFGQRNGQLIRQDEGRFSNYCRGCDIEHNSAWLNCECLDQNNRYVRSRIDMNNYLTNRDGRLCCTSDKATFCGEDTWI